MNTKELAEYKTTLEAEKEKLTKELESFAIKDKELGHNWNTQFPNKEKGDPEEEADDATEYAQLVSVEQSLELKLKDVNISLDKINKGENGKYGICENCEKKIEEKRLQVAPEARLCVECNLQK